MSTNRLHSVLEHQIKFKTIREENNSSWKFYHQSEDNIKVIKDQMGF